MDEKVAMIVVVSLAGVLFLGLAVGGVLVLRDTIRKRGRWGINLRAVQCPGCGAPSPTVRLPTNLRQALWGGCICEACGVEYDKWGVAVGDERPQDCA